MRVINLWGFKAWMLRVCEYVLVCMYVYVRVHACNACMLCICACVYACVRACVHWTWDKYLILCMHACMHVGTGRSVAH
jgi:hypothetical protein